MTKKRQYTKKQYEQAIQLRGKYPHKEIARRLNIHPWTMRNWFYQDYKPRSISNKWRKWNKKRYKNLGLLSKRKKYKIPKISQSSGLAYILGVYLGDGNDWNGFNLSAIDFDFVKKTRDYLQVLFKINFRIRKTQHNTQFRVRFFSRQFRDYLIKKTDKKKIIPKGIFRSSKKIKYAFFAGFFDSEGCVRYHSNALHLSLSQKGQKLLMQFKKLLSTISIMSSVRKDYKDYFKLFIYNKKNLKYFYEEQLFMKRKQDKFNKIWRDKYV